MTDYTEKMRTIAAAVCAVDVELRRHRGQAAHPWESLDEAERARWIGWAESVVGGAHRGGDDAALVSVAKIAAAEVGLSPVAHTSLEAVKRAVRSRLSVSTSAMESQVRDASTALARHVSMYCARRAGFSLNVIGRAFGGRDHTTVMSAVRKIHDMIRSGNTRTREIVAGVCSELNIDPGFQEATHA